MFRRAFRRFCLRLLEMRSVEPDPLLMGRPAVVFSPHFDDETLGAGGTIILKRRRGAQVHLVFMTDGSRSHVHAMPGEQLSALRRREALRAAELLGVAADRVVFLQCPETELARHRDAAELRVTDLLDQLRCEQVFVPSIREPPLWSADHHATTEIVFRALRRTSKPMDVLEYPVWFWHHWPWVPFRPNEGAVRMFKRSLASGFGLAAGRCFNTAIPITSVRSEKRKALEAYASQMVRRREDVPWPVLGDVSGGEFLEQFFGANEYFSRHRFVAGEVRL